ncbi:MAG: hypothetical protein ABI882_10600 [Acidobacteriota bacterium]
MSVYEHKYTPYAGPLTPQARRFFVIPRQAYRWVTQSKIFIGVFALSVVSSLVMAILIYLPHNVNAISLFQIRSTDLFTVGGNAFRIYLTVQTAFAFLMTVLIGPVLISRDLSNNALPLYLSRPFSRPEYLMGKASVLLIMLSLMTWVPGLLLFAFQSYLMGFQWFGENLWIAWGVLITGLAWIAMLTLSSLALSAWIKWRIAASGGLFALFTIPTAIATILSELFRSPWSHLFSPSTLLKIISDDLFHYSTSNDFDPWMILPVWAGWVGLAGFIAFFIFMLSQKVRAYEVVV